MKLKNITNLFNHYVDLMGGIGIAQNDNPELKGQKVILTLALWVAASNLIFFSFVYVQVDRPAAALALRLFALFITINLIAFRFHRNFVIIRNIVFVGTYLYIIIYHTLMGGYIGSTGYILYGVVILNGVTMFYRERAKIFTWYFLFIITAIVLYFLEPIIAKDMVPLSNDFIVITMVNNFILISSMIMLSVNYFTKIIKEEKAKSDTLIRSILPESVVKELNQSGKSNPILVTKATAIFMDFVDFSNITLQMSPQELVSSLNEYFTNFDQIFRDHNVEKLKTIGDGYMAAGGIPETNHSHPVDVALAAMQIILYLEKANDGNLSPWNVRIGINTGPMVAGIIGKSKFSYDVWGSSVNLCARLETASKPGFINVSHDFMEETKDFFEFLPRGLVEIKHGEPTQMYFLMDIKEHLRSSRFQANHNFYELYERYAQNTTLTFG